MSRKSLVRRQNFHLLMAAAINITLVFAPLAYAANFAQEVYGRLYGSWLSIVSGNPEWQGKGTVIFSGDWAMAVYTILVSLVGLTLLLLMFYQQNLQIKKTILWALMGAMVVQILLALLREYQLVGHLGEGGINDFDSHLEAQFWLHFFPIIFAFRALKGVRKDLEETDSKLQEE